MAGTLITNNFNFVGKSGGQRKIEKLGTGANCIHHQCEELTEADNHRATALITINT